MYGMQHGAEPRIKKLFLSRRKQKGATPFAKSRGNAINKRRAYTNKQVSCKESIKAYMSWDIYKSTQEKEGKKQ